MNQQEKDKWLLETYSLVAGESIVFDKNNNSYRVAGCGKIEDGEEKPGLHVFALDDRGFVCKFEGYLQGSEWEKTMTEDEQSNKDDEIHDVLVNPNGEFLGKLIVTYKETGERIPVSPPMEEFRKAIQEEIDAEIMEIIRKVVQDAKKEKP